MKECFVCGEELKCTHPPVELWYRDGDGAHTDCVWRAAKVFAGIRSYEGAEDGR